MDGIRHRERFAEIEALMDSYFRCHIAPVMSKTRTYLTEKQGEEMMEYSTSPGGILSLMASSMQPLADPYQVLKATGEWNSKTTEDYIEMCKAEIAGSEAMQQDLAYMAERWREAVVQEVGRERYDELSRELGCDLAYAFVDYRVEQLMIGRLVEERMPRSSSEYIIRKAAESSLLGLTQTLSRSPLAEEIERRGEAAYRPSKIEKGAAKVLGVSADAVMLGGAGSWTALARFVGMDAAVSAVASRLWPEGPEPLSAELCISKGVFGSDDNVFEGFRREAAAIQAAENALVAEANGRLRNRIPVVSYDLAGWRKPGAEYLPLPDMRSAEERERAERYRDVPLVVAPGQEEAYLQDKARREAAEDGEQHRETGGKEEVWKEGTGEKEGKEEEKDDALREGTALSGEQTREERDGEEAVRLCDRDAARHPAGGVHRQDAIASIRGQPAADSEYRSGYVHPQPAAENAADRPGRCQPAEQGGARGAGKKTNGGKQKHGHDRQRGKIQTLRGRTARPAHCEPGAARQHARGHDRPRALHHTAVAGRGGRLPHGGAAAEHAGQRRARPKRPAPRGRLAELRQRAAGDPRADAGHTVILPTKEI